MLGEQIKQLRLSHEISQVELARALGVTKQSVSNWENNNILPSVELLKKIANYFSCSTDYLLEMNTDAIFIETKDLSLKQIAHIQHIVKDLQELNKQIKSNSDTTSST